MKRLYAVEVNPDEAPFLCIAKSSSEARKYAVARAVELELATTTRPIVSLEGQFPDFEDFHQQYSLIENRHDTIALGGCLFGDRHLERQEILSTPITRLWTLVQDNDIWWICPGRHYVNRLGYLITNEFRNKEEPSYLCEGL